MKHTTISKIELTVADVEKLIREALQLPQSANLVFNIGVKTTSNFDSRYDEYEFKSVTSTYEKTT